MTDEVFYLIGPLILVLILIATFRDYYPEYKTELFTFVGTYLFFICGLKNDSTDIVIFDKTWEELSPILILLSCFITLVTIYFSIRTKRRKKNLQQCKGELEGLENKLVLVRREYYKLCSDIIKYMFSEFFDASGGNGRVSVYKHTKGMFMLLGRYSKNPEYNIRGRETYTDSEGFINIGWQEGVFEIYDIPTWVGNGREYKSFIRKFCDITENSLKQIKMKSCSFYIRRMENEDARNPIGIIVFEQIQGSKINTEQIEAKIDFYKQQLDTLIKSMKTIC